MARKLKQCGPDAGIAYCHGIAEAVIIVALAVLS